MDLLARLVSITGILLLTGLFGVIVVQLARGDISLAGLLATKAPSGAPTFSPARLQMLIATLVAAGWYLYRVATNPAQSSLPDLPPALVAVLGGSHAVYLSGKALDAFIQPLLKNLKAGGGIP